MLILDLVPGETAQNYEDRKKEDQWSEDRTKTFLYRCLKTLNLIHKAGVIHRDLKPSNVILHRNKPWIVDFGISRKLPLKGQMMDFTVIGTAPFQAPETMSRLGLGTFSDIYSLGVTILAITCPLDDETHWQEVIPKSQFSNGLRAILTKMVELNFLQRFQTCQEILDLSYFSNPAQEPLLVPRIFPEPIPLPKAPRLSSLSLGHEFSVPMSAIRSLEPKWRLFCSLEGQGFLQSLTPICY